MGLDYNEVFNFMREFEQGYLKWTGEYIIDYPTNIYVTLIGCKDIEEVKTRVVYALCRPIGKGLAKRDAERLLEHLNECFRVSLTREDLLLMYQELCYPYKIEEFKEFIQRGFPVEELEQRA